MLELPQGRGLLGALIREQVTIRLDDLTADPRSGGFPANHPPMSTFLGVPIRAGDEVLGNLYLTDKQSGAVFSDDDERLVELFADHAAIAIRNARRRRLLEDQNRAIATRNRQLDALNEAAMHIARDLALDKALQHIVDAARELIGARYAALGVPNRDGFLDAFIISGMSREEAQAMEHPPEGRGLLGALIAERKPIRLDNIADDLRSVGFPHGHPPMKTFLGVPIRAGDEILGNLYLTDRADGRSFSAADERLVIRLADHAALAIQNARLYEQVERLAVLEERTRIGMDLHDGVIQSIYGVGLTLESARMTMDAEADETRELIEIAMKGLDGAIRDIRSFILDLRPRRFRGNLVQGVSQLVREFQANAMIPVELQLPAEESLADLPPGMARAAFLTTQEALANVARHARATSVTLTIRLESGQYFEVIDDNGAGFDMDSQSQRIGHGLANMQTRAEELGGHFDIFTSPGKGTRLELRLPLTPYPFRS